LARLDPAEAEGADMKVHTGLTSFVLVVAASLSGADNRLTRGEKSEGWIVLFDGGTLNGWDSRPSGPPAAAGRSGGPGASGQVGSSPRACSTPQGKAPVAEGASHWEVISGSLSPCGEPTGYLTSKASYGDFILTADFRTGANTNSGVFIRAPEGIGGYEVQIWRAQPAGYNTGSIVGIAKTAQEFVFIADRWNHYEITADGDHIIVVLNGAKTLDIHDSKFAAGRLRLQYQKFPIEFRNMKLKVIQH
jgi:hypothetical protein